MTMLFLIRHGAHSLVDSVLVGRMAGVSLSEAGHDQARRLAVRLACERIDAVHSSPQARAQETARPIAKVLGVPVEVASAMDELDAGSWTGQPFATLGRDPLWSLWNTARGSARPPQGESMVELQMRAMQHLNAVAVACPAGRLALVSHAEVIRAIALHVLDMPLDDFHRINIAPASISTVVIEGNRAEIVSLNQPAEALAQT